MGLKDDSDANAKLGGIWDQWERGNEMPFIDWWEKLNVALTTRGEPEALYGEASDWYRFCPNWRNLEPSEPHIINRIINTRK